MSTREELRASEDRYRRHSVVIGCDPTLAAFAQSPYWEAGDWNTEELNADAVVLADAFLELERSECACCECDCSHDNYNTPGNLRDAPCPRCGRMGEEPQVGHYEPVNGWLLDAWEMALKLLNKPSYYVGTVEIADVGIALDDAIASARAQAEDDATPLDQEWLKLIGYLPDHNGSEIGPVHITTRMRTRGDLRKLLAALRISPSSEFSRYADGATGTA